MKVVSLIPARKGSKGLPGKNLIDIAGQPLICHTIKASINSDLIDETWVSSDCSKIKEVAINCGAKFIQRPQNLANDLIMPDASLVHFANNYKFDILVFIQPTSPLLETKYINDGLRMMDKYDSVFSVYKEHWLPKWNEKNEPLNWTITNRPRRQDVKETFVENGAFYITKRDFLLNSNLRYSGVIGTVKMPFSKSFQLDNEDDLEIIKKLL